MKIIKSAILGVIFFYQKLISPLFGPSCRYYPSCSAYAIWQIKHDNIFHAFFAIFVRILRCNPLFLGGVDYPTARLKKPPKSPAIFLRNFSNFKKKPLKFWLIPRKNGTFYIIKVFD